MIKLIKKFKDKSWFILLGTFIIYFIFKLIFYIKGVVFFDEGVYLGIAKYFASGGQIGYFEYIRPLALSTILTPFQWLPFSSLITGRIIGLLLMFMCILIVYYVTNRHFGKKAALWAAFIFATSISVITFGGYILTDLPAFIFALLALSFVLDKKYLFGGIAVGIGFLFKFPVPIVILPLIFCIFLKERKGFLIPSIKLAFGFAIASAPYFLFNFLYYNGSLVQRLFVPLVDASSIVQIETFIYQKTSIFLYLEELIKVEIIPLIFALFASWSYFKKEKVKIVCFWACALTFLFYFYFKVFRFDPRYVTSMIPFIAVLSGAGINIILKNKKNYLKVLLVLFILLLGFTTSIIYYKVPIKNDNSIKDVITTNKTNIITNTAFPIIYSSSKVNLIPTPNLGILYLTYKTDPNYNWLIIDPDSFFCEQDNYSCMETFNNRLMRIIDNNNILDCGYLHGTRIIILTKESSGMSKIECLNKIRMDYLESKPPETNTFFRIVLSFDLEENIKNTLLVEKMINELQKRNISTVLTIESDHIKLSQSSEEFFKNLSNIDIGIITNTDYLSEEFIRNFTLSTNKKISFIVPKDDEWKGKNISITPEISYCIDGSWDNTVLKIHCKKIDLFMVKNWSTGEFYNSSELETMYNSVLDNKIANNEYEIGIDISTYNITKEDYERFKNFINYTNNIRKGKI